VTGKRPLLVLGVLALSLPLGSHQLAAQPTPVGPEVRVDTSAGNPACSKIGVAPDRSFEISWDYSSAQPMFIKARHYAASGSPTDPSEVLIGALEDIPQIRLVSPVSGGFRALIAIVVAVVGDPVKFYQRRIGPTGVPVPGLPRTVAAPPGTRWVSAGPGDSLLAGTYDLASHRYSVLQINPPGQPAGTSHVVNSRPLDDGPGNPAIAKLADGGWVAAFAGTTLAAPGAPARQVLRARRFNAAGLAAGPDFDVNSTPLGAAGGAPFIDVFDVQVAAGPVGGFAVAWAVSTSPGMSIRVRSFNAAGAPVAPEATIGQEDAEAYPDALAIDDSGRVLVLWDVAANPYQLHARLVRPKGSPLGPVFSPDSAVSGDFDSTYCGSVVWAGDSWLISWTGTTANFSPSAVFLRRFR
jgi:hypothetical protein